MQRNKTTCSYNPSIQIIHKTTRPKGIHNNPKEYIKLKTYIENYIIAPLILISKEYRWYHIEIAVSLHNLTKKLFY